jgi:putative ABC transport system permease protein
MRIPSWALGGTAVLVLAIALASGLFALRSLGRAEPATLLR